MKKTIVWHTKYLCQIGNSKIIYILTILTLKNHKYIEHNDILQNCLVDWHNFSIFFVSLVSSEQGNNIKILQIKINKNELLTVLKVLR